jgi:acyl carrier protein
MQPTIAGEVHSFIVNNFLFGKEGCLHDDVSFLEEGIIDSTGVLELVSHLEETYGIEVAEDELTPDNLDSVNRISSYLSRKLSGRLPAQSVAASEACSTI